MLDLGCGMGAASIAASSFFKDSPLKITAVDRSDDALKDAATLFSSASESNHSFSTIPAEIHSSGLRGILGNAKFDIIIAANLLNELADDGEDVRLCRHLMQDFLEEDGYLMIIDPALRETARRLMSLRDLLVEKGEAYVVAPCLHQGYCPMFKANERDWCHFYIEWDRPDLIRRMDGLVGTDHTYLKMAYLILKRPSAFDGEKNKGLHRVVSSPLASKGKCELFLCGFDGALRRAVLLDRNRSKANSAFSQAKRGDIVEFGFDDRCNVSKETNFKIVDRW